MTRAHLLGPVLLLALLPSNVVSAAMPLLLREWQAPNADGGIVFAAYQVGYVLSVLLVLPLTDRAGAGRVITACALITALSFVLFPLLAVNVLSASLLRLCAGLGLAGIYLPGVRIIAATASSRRRGLAVGAYVSAFYLGSATSLWATGALLPAYGWRGAALALALASILAVPLALVATHSMLPAKADPGSSAGATPSQSRARRDERPPPPSRSTGQAVGKSAATGEERARGSALPGGGMNDSQASPGHSSSASTPGAAPRHDAVSGIESGKGFGSPVGNRDVEAPPQSSSIVEAGPQADTPAASVSGRLDLGALRDGAVARNVLAYTGHSWELYVSRGWLAAFVASVLVAQGSDALSASAGGSQWAALMAGFGTPGVLLGGWLSDHFGRARTAVLITLLSGALSLAFGFLGAGPWALLLGAGCLYGLLVSADSAIYSTAITELAAPGRLGSAQAVQAFFGFSATIAAPIAAGKALDLGWGWGAIFVLAGSMGLVLGAPLLWDMAAGRRGQRKNNPSGTS